MRLIQCCTFCNNYLPIHIAFIYKRAAFDEQVKSIKHELNGAQNQLVQSYEQIEMHKKKILEIEALRTEDSRAMKNLRDDKELMNAK